jgi:nitrite reductase/ring-hydroxylating ferredoxin subunit
MPWRPALPEDDLWIGQMAGVTVDGRAVLLINVDGTVHAYEDRCCHKAVPLSLGRLERRRLVCWAHEWEYDPCTGAGLNPTGVALRRYEARIVDGTIEVNIPAGADGR